MGNAASSMDAPIGRDMPERVPFAKTKPLRGGAHHEPATRKPPTVTPKRPCRLRLLKQRRILDYLLMEEELGKRMLADLGIRDAKNEERRAMEKFRRPPLVVCAVEDIFTNDTVVVKPGGSSREYVIPVLSIVDRERLRLGGSVLCTTQSVSSGPRMTPTAVVATLDADIDDYVNQMKIEKTPDVTYEDVGGLEAVIEELKEAVELPLTRPELYEEMGITAPRGVILYGPPGTGKTMLAKCVAHATSATFIRAVGSQLIQKESGGGPKAVRQLFEMARDNAPAIVFLDEVDAIGTKRYDSSSAGEQEVQRTLLELLTALDGFENRGDVKVIMATNRIDTLDPALIRPGRIDRKIEVPMPDEATRRRIFERLLSRMRTSPDVTYDNVLGKCGGLPLTGADIAALCTDAGLAALRQHRVCATLPDFVGALAAVTSKQSDALDQAMLL